MLPIALTAACRLVQRASARPAINRACRLWGRDVTNHTRLVLGQPSFQAEIEIQNPIDIGFGDSSISE